MIAVISLPAGVFNPYSGVKTSILILDKSLAKATTASPFLRWRTMDTGSEHNAAVFAQRWETSQSCALVTVICRKSKPNWRHTYMPWAVVSRPQAFCPLPA